ncbi:TraI/MobA(P) family conjugative relaxase [Shewanella baltica]|uniref:TraI/MobA(P) family conjugative relaxase n=1 Tax=Shewanella baltica TaxID=62322 RepID=UPI0021673326|nr:TraI/MobA(P) family conjugative relaxase [Shewanella baltica]MCS6116857.1 relaxase/mobilization nuclease domain-containing protein [Shewanella baltica]UVW66489.1 relaxase/mobilization nuclease domain-containing protein [Shewanella baltica]
MIAKHVPINSLKKSDFANLVNYITDSQDKIDRVGQISFSNCHSNNLDMAINEILATQQMNTRTTKDKTYHLIVSFRAGENPSKDILNDVEKTICKDLGFAEHQRVSVVHYDTDNVHMHIAINKIHPEKLTAIEPFYPYKTLGKSCAFLEKKHGLELDNHIGLKIPSSGRASDLEHHSGIESLVGWIKRVCYEDIKSSKNWDELHKVMAFNGLALHKKGNGFVIESIESGVFVKASTVDRTFSKAKLEAKLGEFKESDFVSDKTRSYQKEPKQTRVDTSDLYARYLKEQANNKKRKTSILNASKRQKQFEIEMIKRSGKLKRIVISLSDNYLMRKVLYRQASKSLQDNIKKINQKYQSERQALNKNNRRHTWADWLREQAEAGNVEALNALRARKGTNLKGNTFSGQESHHVKSGEVVTKGGAVSYQKGAEAGIRDDGQQLKIARNITAEGVIAALKMAQERFGNTITINGTDEFKTLAVKAAVVGNVQVTFSDPELEKLKHNLLLGKQNGEIKRRIIAGRGFDRSSYGADGRRTANRNDFRPGDEFGYGGRSEQKPDVGAFGARSARPPTTGYNSVRPMSSIDVASYLKPSAVLLPSDARNNMDKHKERRSADSLRWNVFHTKLTPVQMAAAEAYISERLEKKQQGISVPEHRPLTNPTKAAYLGARNVNGVPLMLFAEPDGAVAVLPVSTLKQFKIGEQLSINKDGLVSRARKVKR